MADSRIQQRLEALQVVESDIDLSQIRYSSHGQFIYNLHLVLEHEDSQGDVSETYLHRTSSTIRGVATKNGLLLKGAGIVANHLHLGIGCGLQQAPSDIALWFLNNLAYVHGMRKVYKFGYYVGTYGNFDLGALRHSRFLTAQEL